MSKSEKKRTYNKKIIKNDSINRDKAALSIRLSNMKKNGRKEITTKTELEKFPTGSLISYTNNKGVFRSAGFIDKFEDESFIYMDSNF